MKLLLLSISCCALAFGAGTLDSARALYLEAISSEAGANNLVSSLESLDLSDEPLLLGYLGAGHTLKAQHAFNPYTKYKLFCKGRDQLEAAIAAAPSNTELRFLRFTIQEHAPGFLGYNNKLEEDKAAIIDNLAKGDGNTGIFVFMRAYLLASANCTTEDKGRLSAALPKAKNAETN